MNVVVATYIVVRNVIVGVMFAGVMINEQKP